MRATFIILFFCGLFSGCQENKEKSPPTLSLYVAASLTETIQELGNAFAKDNGAHIAYNFAGSGALVRQMIAAPRGDLFFSANPEWMERAIVAGAIDSSSVRTLLANQLVLVAHRDSDIKIDSPEDLCGQAIEQLSIGDPAYVPAGNYAKQWLQGIACGKSNLWEKFRNSVVPAVDVRAALAQVLTSQEALAIVYRSDYLSRADQLINLYSVPLETGPEIRYAVGMLSEAENPTLAAEFVKYLQTAPAIAIFEKYGFIPIP